MNPPPTLRAFLAGASGTGKSRGAWTHYLAPFPRRLLIDLTGEWEQPKPWGYPGADLTVYDAAELAQALKKLAPRGRWTISCSIGLEQMPDLVAYLLPVPDLAQSPIRTVGGAVLLVDEVDLVAPPRSLREEVRTLWRRSRHVGLSIVATTQRPEAVSREVSAQSHHALCLKLVEPSGIAYMQNLMGTRLDGLEAWCQRHPHGGLWKNLQTGTIRWLTESGQLQAPAADPPPPGRPAQAPPAAPPGPGPAGDAPADDDAAASGRAAPPSRGSAREPEDDVLRSGRPLRVRRA